MFLGNMVLGKVKVKVSMCLTKYHAMKTYGELRYNSTHGGEWSA